MVKDIGQSGQKEEICRTPTCKCTQPSVSFSYRPKVSSPGPAFLPSRLRSAERTSEGPRILQGNRHLVIQFSEPAFNKHINCTKTPAKSGRRDASNQQSQRLLSSTPTPHSESEPKEDKSPAEEETKKERKGRKKKSKVKNINSPPHQITHCLAGSSDAHGSSDGSAGAVPATSSGHGQKQTCRATWLFSHCSRRAEKKFAGAIKAFCKEFSPTFPELQCLLSQKMGAVEYNKIREKLVGMDGRWMVKPVWDDSDNRM